MQIYSMLSDLIRYRRIQSGGLHRFQIREESDSFSHLLTSGLKTFPDVTKIVYFVRVDTGG